MSTDPRLLLPHARRLRERFRSTGFTVDGVNGLLGGVAAAALARGDLMPALQVASGDSELESLVRLFLLGREEAADRVSFLPPVALERTGGGRVRAGVDLRPHDDDWYVASDIARRHPVAADHVIGIGAASLTLLAATIRRPVQSALDVGTGCGVQALHLTRVAARVTATDAVPRAVAMTRLSFALSGFGPEAVELVQGDLFAPVAGRRFDLAVSNPPFVLAPPGPDALAYRDAVSGDDAPLGRLVTEAAAALAPGGVAQVLTSWVVGAEGDWQQRPAELVPNGYDALVLLREVLDPAEHVALWRDEDEAEPAATARGLRWLEHLQRLGAQGIAYGLIVLRRTDAEPRVRLLDVTAEQGPPDGNRLGGWLDRVGLLRGHDVAALRLRAADKVRLVESSIPGSEGWEPADRQLVCPWALPQTVSVDAVTTALLAGCDGRLPLGTVAELLAVASGVAARDVLRVASELVETGHLVPADPPPAPVRGQIAEA